MVDNFINSLFDCSKKIALVISGNQPNSHTIFSFEDSCMTLIMIQSSGGGVFICWSIKTAYHASKIFQLKSEFFPLIMKDDSQSPHS
jgi:hypothetical protein